MKKIDVITIQGEVQLMKRKWYQLYKKGWHRHYDFWGQKHWIRFNWDSSNGNKLLL